MEIQTGFDTFIEATRYMFRGPSPREILIFIIVTGTLVVIVAVPFFYLRWERRRRLKRLFFLRARDFDLTEDEAELLWKYATRFPLNPTVIFENKVFFEKVVDQIVKSGDPNEIRLIPSIRSKLRYDTLPWFIPLSTTRDIDLYQTGVLMVDSQRTEAYVFDKDEEFIYLAVIGTISVKEGDEVKFFFVRDNDARYNFSGRVEKVFTEMGRIVIALRHTDKLNRIQLRETIRWKVNVPVRFGIAKNMQGLKSLEYEGIIEDISIKGARVCFQGHIRVESGDYIILDFSLKGYEFKNIIGRVVYKKVYERKTCLGVKFEELSRKEEQVIEKYILDEQRKLLKAYKLGESEHEQ